MPGETNVAQQELLVYDLAGRTMVKVKAERFKDQRLGPVRERQFIYPDSDEPRRALWLADNADQVYFWRRSRDQHKVDVCVADAATGEVTVLIEERLNTYVEHQDLELLALRRHAVVVGARRLGAPLSLRPRRRRSRTGSPRGPWHVRRHRSASTRRAGSSTSPPTAASRARTPTTSTSTASGLDGSGLDAARPRATSTTASAGRVASAGSATSGMSESNRVLRGQLLTGEHRSRRRAVRRATGRKMLDLERPTSRS